VGEDLEKLKQRLSLLDYLWQQNWVARPSFYVNTRKNLLTGLWEILLVVIDYFVEN